MGSDEVSGVSRVLELGGARLAAAAPRLNNGLTPFEGGLVYALYASSAAAMDGYAMKSLVGNPSMEAFTAPLTVHSAT